jgi:hypothetical protein
VLTLLMSYLHVFSSRGENLLQTSDLHGLVSPPESHGTCMQRLWIDQKCWCVWCSGSEN